MVNYSLKMHSWDVMENGIVIARHTGFNLVTFHDDNSVTIECIDFGPGELGGSIDINRGAAVLVTFVNKDNPDITQSAYWQSYEGSDATTEEMIEELKYYNSDELLSGTSALEAFNKIKLNAVLTNMSDKIDYDPISWETRVCNTATNYWGTKYISGFDSNIYNTLPGAETNLVYRGYYGAEDDYINASNGKQAAKLKFIENVVNILAQQGKVDEALSDTEPYLSEKYRQILEPILQRELFSLKDKVVEDVVTLVTCITTGSISLSIMCYMISQIDAQSTNHVNRLGAQSHHSPLVLDLDGDGVVETNKENSTVYFDHDNNGFAESSGWVGADDGLLVRDINNNGLIDDGTELFGNNSGF